MSLYFTGHWDSVREVRVPEIKDLLLSRLVQINRQIVNAPKIYRVNE